MDTSPTIKPKTDQIHVKLSTMELLQSVFDSSSLKAQDIPKIKGVQLVGTIDINIHTGQHIWSDDLFHFLGLKPGEIFPNNELFLSYVVDEDQAHLRSAIRECFDGLKSGSYDLFKILNGAGHITSVAGLVEHTKEPEIYHVRLFDVSMFVGTNRRKDNFSDHLSSKWLNRVFENKVTGIFILNRKGQFLRTNSTYQQWTGYSGDELKKLNVLDVIPSEEWASCKSQMKQLISGEEESFSFEKQLLTKSGELKWVEVNGSVIDEESFYVLGYLTDIHDKKITREKFQSSEDQLYEAQKIAKIGSWEVDLKTHNLTWSRGMFDLMEVSYDFVPDVESVQQFIHPDDLELFKNFMFTKMELKDLEARHVTKSGVKHVLINSKLELDDNGDPKRYYGTTQDVSAMVIESKRLQLVQETAKLGWWESDLITGESKWSDSIYELFGLDKESTKPSFESFLETTHIDDRQKIIDAAKDPDFLNNGWHNYESRHRGPDGTYRYFATSGRYICDGDRPIKMIGTLMDISDIKEMQTRVEEAQNIANIGWWEVNLLSGESMCSDTAHHILELETGDNTKLFSRFAQRVHPDDQEWLQNILKHQRDGWVNKELRYMSQSGGYKYLTTSGRVYFDGDTAIKLVGTLMDVTALKETHIKLEQAQKLAKVGWWEFDLSGELNNWYSPEHMEIMGIKNFDEISTYEDFYNFIHPDDLDRVKQEQAIGFEKGGWSNMVHRIITKSGEVKHITCDATIEFVDGKPFRLFGTVYDITELKEIEGKLSGNLVNMEAMVKSMDNVVLIADENLVYKEVFSKTPVSVGDKPLTGMSVSDKLDDPGMQQLLSDNGLSKESILKKYQDALNGKKVEPYLIKQHINGMDVWLETKLHAFEVEDGSKWLAITLIDITAKKKAEEELIKSVQKEKELSELRSEFVSMASHQFRTPLTVIKANMQLLELSGVQSPVIDKVSHRLNAEVDRLVNLMEDIMGMGKVQSNNIVPKLKPTDITAIVNKIKTEVERQQKDGRMLAIQVDGEAQTLLLDEQFIEHALHNLIDNAFKYSPNAPNPEVRIQFSPEKIDIRVKDFGIGIPKKDQDNLFNSFQRGSNSQHIQGTGLGLAVAKEFVQLNNGTIYLNRESNEGTEFCIELPVKTKKS